MVKKNTINTELRRKLNAIQQEVSVGTWDNVFLALTLFVIGMGVALILAGLSNLSPNWFLIILISFMALWFILQNFSLLLDSIFFRKNRFTNKSKFISFTLSIFVFLILLVGLPYLLIWIFKKSYPLYFNTKSLWFYLLALVVYGTPILLCTKIFYPRIKKFFKNNCPTLILKRILLVKGDNQKILLKHWNTTLSELRKKDREY